MYDVSPNLSFSKRKLLDIVDKVTSINRSTSIHMFNSLETMENFWSWQKTNCNIAFITNLQILNHTSETPNIFCEYHLKGDGRKEIWFLPLYLCLGSFEVPYIAYIFLRNLKTFKEQYFLFFFKTALVFR